MSLEVWPPALCLIEVLVWNRKFAFGLEQNKLMFGDRGYVKRDNYMSIYIDINL